MNIENLKYYILKVYLKDVVIGYCTQTKKKIANVLFTVVKRGDKLYSSI